MNNQNKKESQLLHDFHLNEDNLSNDAKQKFPFHTDILDSLNFYGHNALENENLTSAARHILCCAIIHKHENVKSVLNYLASTSIQSRQSITDVPMIIICGILRTGTTLLHNLMACDPNCRAPFITDMTIHPIPPILCSDITEHKRRMENEEDRLEKIYETAGYDRKQITKDRVVSHPEFMYEEDVVLLEEVGPQGSISLLAPKHRNMVGWFTDKNKDFAYEYHQTVLQMLHDVNPPQTHWQLKSPMHTLWLDSLLKYYPKASIIMSHRHLDEVIPSACRIILNYNSIYFNENDSQSMKITFEQAMTLLDIWIERIVEYRIQQPSPQNIFDIQYKDLMRDPIGTVRRIYDHFDFLHWSDEFEKAMHTWLVNNPQGKQGRHSYSLDEFGLAKSETKDIYRQYENLFLRD